MLEENNKLAKASEYLEEAGYIFVNENKGGKKQKIVLEIVSNSSECVSVGFGDVDEFRNSCSFINDSTFLVIQEQWTTRLSCTSSITRPDTRRTSTTQNPKNSRKAPIPSVLRLSQGTLSRFSTTERRLLTSTGPPTIKKPEPPLFLKRPKKICSFSSALAKETAWGFLISDLLFLSKVQIVNHWNCELLMIDKLIKIKIYHQI